MSEIRLLILGTGDQAVVQAHAARAAGIAVAGFMGRTNRRAPADKYSEGDCSDSAAIAGAAKKFGATHCIAAFGDNLSRQDASLAVGAAGLALATLVHPTAVVDGSAAIADGVFIAQGCQIACNAKLGRGALINSGAVVEHDCVIGDFAAVYSGAVLGGGVVLAPRAAVGLGATLLPGLEIGDDCVIGAGSVVTRNQPALSVVVGAPAKVVRQRTPEEPYVS